MRIWRIWIYHSRDYGNEKDNLYNDPYACGIMARGLLTGRRTSNGGKLQVQDYGSCEGGWYGSLLIR